MPDLTPARGPSSPLTHAPETDSRLATLVLRVLLVIALVWIAAIAVSLATRPDAAEPARPAPSGDESPGGTRPALHAERIAALAARAASPTA